MHGGGDNARVGVAPPGHQGTHHSGRHDRLCMLSIYARTSSVSSPSSPVPPNPACQRALQVQLCAAAVRYFHSTRPFSHCLIFAAPTQICRCPDRRRKRLPRRGDELLLCVASSATAHLHLSRLLCRIERRRCSCKRRPLNTAQVPIAPFRLFLSISIYPPTCIRPHPSAAFRPPELWDVPVHSVIGASSDVWWVVCSW